MRSGGISGASRLEFGEVAGRNSSNSSRTPHPAPAVGRRIANSATRPSAVIELPDDLREAFTLRFWHEFEYEEIGTVQGVAAGVAQLAILRRPTTIAG